MFVGVLNKKNATHLWRMLYFQGIFWILSAVSTEVPSVVSGRNIDALCCFPAFLCIIRFFQGPPFLEHERCVAYDFSLTCLFSLVRYQMHGIW